MYGEREKKKGMRMEMKTKQAVEILTNKSSSDQTKTNFTKNDSK